MRTTAFLHSLLASATLLAAACDDSSLMQEPSTVPDYTAGSANGAANTAGVTIPSTVSFAPEPPTALRAVRVTNQTELRDAIFNALPGDSIHVVASTYVGGVLWPNGKGGTAANPITVWCEPGAIIDRGGRDVGYGFRLRGPYIQVRGCTIQNAGFLIWVEPTPAAKKTPRGPDPVGVVLSDLTLRGADRNAVIFNGAHRSYLQRSTITDIGNTGTASTEAVYVGTSSTTAPWLMSDSVSILGNRFGPYIEGEDVDIKGYAASRRSIGTLVQGNYSDATGKFFCAHNTGCGPSTSGAFSEQGGQGTLFVDDTVANINSAGLNAFWWDTSADAMARRNRAAASENSYGGTGAGYHITNARRDQTSVTIYCDNEGPTTVSCTP